MNINASNYVVRLSAPSAPRISVDVQAITSEEITSAIGVYETAASAYADTYTALIDGREYVTDRLQKDLSAEIAVLTDGGIDLVTNTVTLNVKANELYERAAQNVALTTVAAVSSIETAFNGLFGTYYLEGSDVVLSAVYDSAVEYDTRAYVVDSDIASAVVSETIFINDIPNATGKVRTYTAYVSGGESAEAAYTIAYDNAYVVDSSTTGAWVLKPAGDTTAIAYAVVNSIDENTTWSDVITP